MTKDEFIKLLKRQPSEIIHRLQLSGPGQSAIWLWVDCHVVFNLKSQEMDYIVLEEFEREDGEKLGAYGARVYNRKKEMKGWIEEFQADFHDPHFDEEIDNELHKFCEENSYTLADVKTAVERAISIESDEVATKEIEANLNLTPERFLELLKLQGARPGLLNLLVDPGFSISLTIIGKEAPYYTIDGIPTYAAPIIFMPSQPMEADEFERKHLEFEMVLEAFKKADKQKGGPQ